MMLVYFVLVGVVVWYYDCFVWCGQYFFYYCLVYFDWYLVYFVFGGSCCYVVVDFLFF